MVFYYFLVLLFGLCVMLTNFHRHAQSETAELREDIL